MSDGITDAAWQPTERQEYDARHRLIGQLLGEARRADQHAARFASLAKGLRDVAEQIGKDGIRDGRPPPPPEDPADE